MSIKPAELRFKPKRKKKDVKLSKEELAQLKALEERMERQNWMMNSLKPGERLDDLMIKGYEIIQSPGRFCWHGCHTSVFFATVKKNETALDLGSGTGILPILLEAKNEGAHYTGLEIQEESADMARRSVSHNRLQDKVDIVTGDIKEASAIFGAASFHVITTNPPKDRDHMFEE